MIDSHAHLNDPQYDKDRLEVIGRAFNNGLKYIINIGSDLETSQVSIDLAQKYENIYAAVGIHPMAEVEIGCDAMKDMTRLTELTQKPKVVAIGECGLEMQNAECKMQNDKLKLKRQKEIFLAQIDLAKKLGLPLVIHCRNAHNEILEMLSGVKNLKAVIHCFSGSWQQAEKYLNLGCYLSFTGIITYARDYDKVIKNMPLEKIMAETDCPYLAPAPFRGARNEPVYVRYVYETIARVRNEAFEKIEKQLDKNAVEFFNLEAGPRMTLRGRL